MQLNYKKQLFFDENFHFLPMEIKKIESRINRHHEIPS